MSKRRKAGDWVWLVPNSGFVGESNRLRAEIRPEDDPPQPKDDPPPCFLECGDDECVEWTTLWTEEDGDKGRHMLCHVSECRMLDEPFKEEPTPVRCGCGGCPWCDSGCAEEATTFDAGQHMCAGCTNVGEDE